MPEDIAFNDKLDLRPAADTIVRNIIARRQVMKQEEPLFVPVGELHTRLSPQALILLVMAKLPEALKNAGLEGQTIALGYEEAHNVPDLLLANLGLQAIYSQSPHLRAALADKNGWRSVQNFLAESYEDCRPSKGHLLAYCLKKRISVRYNDVAKIHGPEGDKYIDFSDYESRQLCPTASEHLLVNTLEPMGIALRNKMLQINAVRHAHSSNAHIYIVIPNNNRTI